MTWVTTTHWAAVFFLSFGFDLGLSYALDSVKTQDTPPILRCKTLNPKANATLALDEIGTIHFEGEKKGSKFHCTLEVSQFIHDLRSEIPTIELHFQNKGCETLQGSKWVDRTLLKTFWLVGRKEASAPMNYSLRWLNYLDADDCKIDSYNEGAIHQSFEKWQNGLWPSHSLESTSPIIPPQN